MDRLKQIESFVSVASKGSLTAAAALEGVAPAVMGRRIDALEARLGVKLLVRTTRRITLTHEGSAFLEDCQRLLVDFNNAEASVSAPPKTPSPPSSHFNAWYFPTSSHLSTQYSGLAVPSSQLSSSSGASW